MSARRRSSINSPSECTSSVGKWRYPIIQLAPTACRRVKQEGCQHFPQPGGLKASGLAVVDLCDDAMNVGRGEDGYGAGAVGAGIGRRLRHVGIVDVGGRQRALAAVQPFDAEIARGVGARGFVERARIWVVLGADDRDVRG